MRTPKRKSSIHKSAPERVIKVKDTTKALENYLLTCPNHSETYSFPDDYQAAYDFGNKLRENAMKEEGVQFANQMKKFKIDIAYDFVRISIVLVEELARR
jgi:hypothetical protein